MTHTHMRPAPWIGLLAFVCTLPGCASLESTPAGAASRIKITSAPTGALVLADGAEIGRTPLEITPGEHFRSGFVGLSYRYYGKLTVKAPGCDTWTTEVNDRILAKDIQATLKCAPGATPAAERAPAPATAGDPAVERLERLETLREKGLISDDEYRQLRARVLEKL